MEPDSSGVATFEKGVGFVAVTGAGGSVAPAVAVHFLETGHTVALFDRQGKEERIVAREQRFTQAAEEGRLVAVGADLSSEGAARKAFEDTSRRLGHCHTLINLAGGFAMGLAQEAQGADLEHMLDVNLRSAVNATSAVLPAMLDQGSGHVLAIGAGAALSPAPGKSAYAAAKAAVAAYFGALAAEVGKRGVGVAVLHPMGTIDTQANRDAMPDADPSNWITVAAMVEAVHYLATRPAGGRVHELRLHAV